MIDTYNLCPDDEDRGDDLGCLECNGECKSEIGYWMLQSNPSGKSGYLPRIVYSPYPGCC